MCSSDLLGIQESVLQGVTSLIQDVKTLAVNAGSSTLTDTDLGSIAAEIEGRYAELIGLANATDGNGQFLFSGYKGGTQPFAEVAPGSVGYFGDQGSRLVQISPTRQLSGSDPGSDIFQRIRNGNGTFATAAAAANAGTGIIAPGTVVNSTAPTGHSYTIAFSVTAGEIGRAHV